MAGEEPWDCHSSRHHWHLSGLPSSHMCPPPDLETPQHRGASALTVNAQRCRNPSLYSSSACHLLRRLLHPTVAAVHCRWAYRGTRARLPCHTWWVGRWLHSGATVTPRIPTQCSSCFNAAPKLQRCIQPKTQRSPNTAVSTCRPRQLPAMLPAAVIVEAYSSLLPPISIHISLSTSVYIQTCTASDTASNTRQGGVPRSAAA